MTWKEILEGEEMTINAVASDIEFVQKLIALNEQITDEINLQANGLLLDEGARGSADSFNYLKALVGEMHTLLSDTVFNEARKAGAMTEFRRQVLQRREESREEERIAGEMTEQERQETKAKLIELGFWCATEHGDPVTDHRDSQTLQERLSRLLANDVTLASTGFSIDSPAQGVEVVKGRSVYPLATADSYPEAICLAALALPEFLRQHPECAADQK